MLEVCCSNRMEALAALLAERLGAAAGGEPSLTPVTVVVPDGAVGQFLRFRVAEALGVAANVDFVFLRGFLRGLVETDALRVLSVDALELLLYARLSDPAFVAAPALGPVRAWLEVADGAAERDARALQLAGQIARLFEEYASTRPDLLRRWRRADAPEPGGTERWQRWLYRALFDEAGAARVTGADAPAEPAGQLHLFGAGPRWHLLPGALEAVPADRLALPPVIHVFGLSYVASAFAHLFARLAAATQICVYALTPCRALQEDPEATDDAPSVQALRLWGRPGQEYLRLLEQLGAQATPCFVNPAADGAAPSLLGQLQRDILLRAPAPATKAQDDRSVRFLACPSVRREVEAVADKIWALVRDDDRGGDRLRFHEIAVMVADARADTYLTHVEAVFRERHGLPFTVIDRRLSARSRVPEALDRLLALPGSDFGHAEMLALLTHPLVGGGAPDADPARWRAWCAALNVYFGADREALRGTYIDRDVYNWDQALRRLVLGTFMTGERSGDGRVFEAGRDRWLPFETGPEEVVQVARLVTLVRRLVEDARALATARLCVADWCRCFTRLVQRALAPQTPADERALDRCLEALEALAEADLARQPVPFPVARDLLRARLGALDASRGQHQADGVVVSTLLPMRVVPFRVVFVMGLGEGQFPAPSRDDALDLRRDRRRAGDVTPAERDRYLFLETLLAARERVVLSYVARDATTGEPLEPSPVVRELQFVLQSYLDPPTLSALTTVWPVSPYTAAGAPPTASPAARRGAAVRALREHLEGHLGHPPPPALLRVAPPDVAAALSGLLCVEPPPDPPPEAAPLALSLSAIVQFLQSPLQGAAQSVLGLSEDDGGEAPADEPLALDRPRRLALLREAFWAGAGDPEATRRAYARAYELRALRGEVPVGLFAEVRREEDLALLASWAGHAARLGLLPLSGWPVVRLGGGAEYSAADVVHPPLGLSIPVPHGRHRAVEIHGAVARMGPQGDVSVRCLGVQQVQEAHFLPAFVSAATLSAAGCPGPQDTLRVVALPAAPGPAGRCERRYRVPPPDVAQAWLIRVVTDLLGEAHDYRLPVEVVVRWNRDLRFNSRARPTLAYGEVDSDQYGPIPDPRRFKLPDPAIAWRIVDRRLGIWFNAEV